MYNILNSIIGHHRTFASFILTSKIVKILAIVLFILFIDFLLLSPMSKSQISNAVIQEILDGDQVFIDKKQARVKDEAKFGEVILTQDSRAGIQFNNGASGRLGDNSKVTVGQCVEVEKGELLVSGPVNGCMSGINVAVKGTLYLLKRAEDNSSLVKVLEGTVQVTNSKEPGKLVEVKSGEKCKYLAGVLSPALPMSQDEIIDTLKGKLFSGFQIPVTAEGALDRVCEKLLPGSNCSTNGLPSYPVPIPSIPVPFKLPFY
jgi:hypothetical protein